MVVKKLDTFRVLYTINTKDEKDSNNKLIGTKLNLFKIAMWIPIVSQVFSVILLKLTIEAYREGKREGMAGAISRSAIGFFATPLLPLIDLVGTAVKSCIDARNKKRENNPENNPKNEQVALP